MTGTLQTHARKYEVAVDELTFNFNVLKTAVEDITDTVEDGVIVYGMHLEGARFNMDSMMLEDSLAGTSGVHNWSWFCLFVSF